MGIIMVYINQLITGGPPCMYPHDMPLIFPLLSPIIKNPCRVSPWWTRGGKSATLLRLDAVNDAWRWWVRQAALQRLYCGYTMTSYD